MRKTSNIYTEVGKYHFVFLVLCCLGALPWVSLHHVISLGMGSALIGVNLIILIWAWKRIFLKKTVALAVSVIVLKYAFLLAAVYTLVGRQLVDPLSFIAGLATVVLTIGVLGIRNHRLILELDS